MKHRRELMSVFLIGLLIVLAPGAHVALAQKGPQSLAAKADSLLVALDRSRTEYRDLESRLETLHGQDSLVAHRELLALGLDAFDRAHELVGLLKPMEDQGLDTEEMRKHIDKIMERGPAALDEAMRDVHARLDAARSRKEGAPPSELVLIESEIAELEKQLDRLYEIRLRHVQITEQLGMDSAGPRADLTTAISQRAQFTAGRLRLSIEERDRLEEQAKRYPDDASIRQRADAAGVAVERGVKSLDRTVRVMHALGMEVTEYRTLLVRATGEIARGLSDRKVAVSMLQRWLADARQWFVTQGPTALVKILIFLAILAAFRILSRFVRRAVARSIDSSRMQPTQLLRNMILNVSGNLVVALGLLIALSQIGISLGPLLAGVGVAGFILGFALQDTLGNFAAGLMVLFYKPYDVGDFVEAGGVSGKVSGMSLVSTTILTFDNQTLIVPNGKIWGDVIRNVTAQDKRRVDMVFGISYDSDIPHAESILKAILEENEKVLKEPEPVIRLHELADSSVNFVVRPWVRTADYWEVYWGVTREVKMRFDREGIGIPFPQRDVHIYNATNVSDAAESSQKLSGAPDSVAPGHS